MKRRHGFVYTLFTIMLVGSIIALVALQTTPTANFRVAEKVKTDEMTYFLKGIQEDLQRTTQISGKRAVISIIDKEVLNGTYIQNVNESIRIAMIEGTYNGTPLSLTTDNTLEAWEFNMNELAEERGTNALIDFTETTIVPSAAFLLSVASAAETTVIDTILEISVKRSMAAVEEISVDGLEDPLNTIESNTYISQRFEECETLAGTSSSNDWFTGRAYLTNQTNLSTLSGSGRIAIVINASSIVDAGNFEGYVSEENVTIASLIPDLQDTIVVGVPNAQSLIVDNSYITVNDMAVYLTGVTPTSESHTCYFLDPNGPSILDRLEGNYNTTTKYSSQTTNQIGIGSYIYIRNMPPEMQYGSGDYQLDYEYWKNFP